MSKQALLLIALLVCFTASAQKTHQHKLEQKMSRDISKNEVKLNLATTIFGSFPEVSYERILNNDLSVGASLGVSLEDDAYLIDFIFAPYVRWFFGGNSKNLDKYGSGFFIEANGAILSDKNDDDESYNRKNDTEVGVGLGVAVGWKYLTRNNWVGEIYLGGGRNFSNGDNGYPRLGITIGKRF